MTSKTEGTDVWTFDWDYENHLTTATKATDSVYYSYDALGRRIRRYKTGGVENTKFIYDGNDVLVDDNSGTLTKYLNGDGIDNKLRVQTGSDVQYFLADHLGSTNGLTDASGNLTSSASYDSFGNATGNLNTRYQFTGREYDSFTSLHYYRARWYDAQIGRFISEDPIGFAGGDVNLYGYVKNKPLKYRDPRGLDDADREFENRINPPPTPNPWYWSHNETADNPPIPPASSLSDAERERIQKCYQRNKFSALFSGIPYGEGTVEIVETGSLISLGLDGVATAAKTSGPKMGSNPYGSGINMVSRRISRNVPKIGGKTFITYARPIGDKATPALAVFGAFTFSYNTTVDIQCICGLLE